MEQEDYAVKEKDYFKHVRLDIVDFIKSEKGLNVLDIGGGAGATLMYLKDKGIANKIHLFDIVDQTVYKEKFDSITIGDINKVTLHNEHYDVIIMSDVLEHFLDPNIIIEKAKNQLKENGKLLISMPNIQFIKAMYKVFIKGSFKYEDKGIFDRTHLRFYCKQDMVALFETHKDLKITKTLSINKYSKSKLALIDKITFGLFSPWLSMQYLLEIKKV